MRYSTCFAFTIRSVTSSFLFAAARESVQPQHERESPSPTFEHVRLVVLVLVTRLGHRDLRRDLEKVGAGGEVRDGTRHYRQ